MVRRFTRKQRGAFEDDAEETAQPATQQDVEDPKPHEAKAKLVEGEEIDQAEVVHNSHAKVACLLSALIWIALVIVLGATVLTRNKGGDDVSQVVHQAHRHCSPARNLLRSQSRDASMICFFRSLAGINYE